MKNRISHFLLVLRDMLDALFHFEEVSILCYHSISDADVPTAIGSKPFERHLQMLQQRGAQFVSLQEVAEWVVRGAPLPRKAVALTFDDGYADFETAALPILEKYQAPATIFVVGNEAAARTYLGNDTPLLSSEAVARLRTHPLVEAGFHSMTHANLSKLSGDTLEAECRAPFPARFFAYPGGNHSPAAVEAVRKLGYSAACSIGMNLVSRASNSYLLPRSVILADMPLWRVRMATTKALRWYRALTAVLGR